jgi:hypothetical protein
MLSADDVIQLFGMAPLPGEGGWFRETWRSERRVSVEAPATKGNPAPTPPRSVNRAAGTAIHYLLTPDTKSALHRLTFDEVWFFHRAEPAEGGIDQWLLDESTGSLETIRLGSAFERGERLQSLVPAGAWQGARLSPGTRWALVSTVVAPGFEFADWELAGPDLPVCRPEQAEALRPLLAGG